MMPAVLDEDPADVRPPEERSRQIDSGHVAFEGLRVVHRNAVLALRPDPAPFEEAEVGLVAHEREHGIRRHALRTRRRVDTHRALLDPDDAALKEGADRAGANAVLEVGLDPVFDTLGDRGA